MTTWCFCGRLIATLMERSLPRLCVLVSVLVVCAASDADLLDYEPVQYLKAHVGTPPANPVWDKLLESSPQEAKELVLTMKDNLNQHLSKSGVSLVFTKGDRVLVKRLANVKWDSSIEVPFAGIVSLIGVTLPILLENYKHSVIADPMSEVLKGEHRDSPLLKGHEQQSLLDLLNTLPSGTSTSIKETVFIGKLAHFFVNTVLEKFAKEAWMDALLSVGMDDSTFDATLKTTFDNLIQYTLMLSHDFETLDHVPKKELFDLNSGHYLFGWWVNCAQSTCLIPEAPPGTIFSITQSLRIYLSPSLDLSLLVLASNSKAKTVAEALDEDRGVWRQLYSAMDEEIHSHAGDQQGRDVLIDFIHWIWPIIVFLFLVTSSHVWVYWLCLGVWFVFTSLYPRTHIQRPKTAKGD